MFLYLLIWCPNNETLMNNKSGSFRMTLRGDAVGRNQRSGKRYLCKFTWGFASITNYKPNNNHDWLDWKDTQSIVDWINSLNYASWMTLHALYQTDTQRGKNKSKDGRHQTRQLQRKSFTSNRVEGGFFKALCHKFFICIWLWGRWGKGEGQSGGKSKASTQTWALGAKRQRKQEGEGADGTKENKIIIYRRRTKSGLYPSLVWMLPASSL